MTLILSGIESLHHTRHGTRTTTITVAGEPGPDAVRELRHFSRDRQHAEQLAESAWESHRAQWVGEWHTHTRGAPVPSETDLTTYVTHLRDPELNFAHFISLIVAVNASGPALLVAWLIDTQAARQTPLQLIKEEPRARDV